MEYFIQYKDNLLTNYEWAGGELISPKINKARWSLVKKNQAEIVTEDFFSKREKTKITRK